MTTIAAQISSNPVHFHRWRIEEPDGTISRGICSVCQERREFHNWLPQLDYITRAERTEE
jgi:hypothetical protein